MAPDYAWPLDVLTRVVKYSVGAVYVVITAEGAYASPIADGVKVVETKSDPEIIGIGGGPLLGTLLECSKDAGADFASVTTTGFDVVWGTVCPKTEEIAESWFDMCVRPLPENDVPSGPYLWHLTGMVFTAPRLVHFKIRYEPHLVGGEGGKGTAPMVQMYPNTGATEQQFGWQVYAYRTDTKGTEDLFMSPPEWATDTISIFGAHGLLFGKDPSLIAEDIPFV